MNTTRWSCQSPRVIVLLLVALLLSGCGARAPYAVGESAAAPAASDTYAAPQEAQAGGTGVGVADNGATSALLNRKMVARASIDLVVADANAAVTQIQAILDDVGGFVAAANLYNQAASGAAPVMAGNLTLRVPAEALDETMTRLEGVAQQVGAHSITREDVTDQYTDLDAQLRNLQATEEELRALLTEVRERPNATAADILEVHNRLTEIRGQIESVQGRKNMLDNLIGLSTIEVSLVPDASMLPVVESGWRPIAEARNAVRALVSSLQTLGTFAIWFVVAVLPILLLIALPFVLLALIVRALLRRRAAPRAAAQPAASGQSS